MWFYLADFAAALNDRKQRDNKNITDFISDVKVCHRLPKHNSK